MWEEATRSLHTDELLLFCGCIKESLDNCFDGVHAKPVSSVDEGRSPLRFSDKVAEKMRF